MNHGHLRVLGFPNLLLFLPELAKLLFAQSPRRRFVLGVVAEIGVRHRARRGVGRGTWTNTRRGDGVVVGQVGFGEGMGSDPQRGGVVRELAEAPSASLTPRGARTGQEAPTHRRGMTEHDEPLGFFFFFWWSGKHWWRRGFHPTVE